MTFAHGTQPIFRIRRQHLGEHAPQVLRQRGQIGRFAMVLDRLGRRRAHADRPTGRQREHDPPQTVDVRPWTNAPIEIAELFGRCERQLACERLVHGPGLRGIDILGDPEVDDLGVRQSAERQQDVVGRNVAVDGAQLVRRAQTLRQSAGQI